MHWYIMNNKKCTFSVMVFLESSVWKLGGLVCSFRRKGKKRFIGRKAQFFKKANYGSNSISSDPCHCY